MSVFLFDLYGTLIDLHTNEKKASLWRAMARIYSMQGANYEATELKKKFARLRKEQEACNLLRMREKFSDPYMEDWEIEADLDLIFKELYEKQGVAVSDEMINFTALAFRSISMSYIRLFDGVIELLDAIHEKGHKAYLLSNAQASFTRPEMVSLGIYDKFDGIFFSSEIGVMKPSRHFYNSLIEEYGLDKSDCTMVGNEYAADCMGAHNAGLKSIYIHTEQSGKTYGPIPEDGVEIHDIREVMNYL